MTEQPTKPLIVTGSHADVLADIEAIPRFHAGGPGAFDFMAVGLDAVDRYAWPIRWCATFHPVEIPSIRARREGRIGRVDFSIISHERRDGVDLFVPAWWTPSGSSALLAVQAAITLLGYRRVVLAGCPLTGKNAQGGDYENFHRGWEPRRKDLIPRVRSMSGWTAEFLGKPTEDWLWV